MKRTLEFINETYNVSLWQLRRMPHELYLQTEHWKHFRAEALKFFRTCQLCDGYRNLDVYHKNYKNRGRETFNDVTVICHDCHAVAVVEMIGL